MRGRSRLGSFRSELGIGEIDAQGTCGGSGADMDWCACLYCGEKLVLGGSVFSSSVFWSYFPFLPSLCHSLTSSEIKHTKGLSEKSSTPDHVCQWTIDKCTPKLFFTHCSRQSYFFSPPLPSPPLSSQKKKKEKNNSQKQTAQQAPTAPSHKLPPPQSHKPSPQKPTEIH